MTASRPSHLHGASVGVADGPSPSCVLVIGAVGLWPAEILTWISEAGYRLLPLHDISVALSHVLLDGVSAVLVRTHQISIREEIAFQMCRKVSPRTAIVALSGRAEDPATHALSSTCVTAWLNWPMSREILLSAVGNPGQTRTERRKRPRAPRSGAA